VDSKKLFWKTDSKKCKLVNKYLILETTYLIDSLGKVDTEKYILHKVSERSKIKIKLFLNVTYKEGHCLFIIKTLITSKIIN